MKDKTIQMNWLEWKDYCAVHDINPREFLEDHYDLGGGNSITFECYEDPPEEEMFKLSQAELLDDLEKAVGLTTVAYEQIKEMIKKGIPILWEHDRFKVLWSPGRDKTLDANFVAVLKDAIRHGIGEKEFLEGIIKEYEKSEEEK